MVRFATYIIIALFIVTLPLFTTLPIVSLVTKVLIFGLLAMSLDLLVGYSGLWSFGHAAFFGVAAYTTGILITRYGITSFWLSAPASVLAATLVAALFGYIALRVSDIYFLLITFALGQLVFSLAMKWVAMTGGSVGLVGIPYPDFGFSWDSPTGFYYFVLLIFIVCSILLYLVTKSPFGAGLQGIRESEIRMRCLGYNTWLYKYIAFIIGGLFAGIAGILYVHFNGVVTPTEASVATSGLIWLMLIIGGTGTLWGALIGSGVILFLQYFISILTPQRWPLIMGACLIASVIVLRGGIFPHLVNLWMKVRQL
jgi:branched-chain amino acid transport system permease protein